MPRTTCFSRCRCGGRRRGIPSAAWPRRPAGARACSQQHQQPRGHPTATPHSPTPPAALQVHERAANSSRVDILTKGDNNWGDDRSLYPPGQLWLNRGHIMGKVVG